MGGELRGEDWFGRPRTPRSGASEIALLVAVLAHMSLGSFGAMFMGVHLVALSGMGVMGGLLVVSRIVMFGGRVVMFGGVLVMFRSLAVVLSSFHGHDEYSPGL